MDIIALIQTVIYAFVALFALTCGMAILVSLMPADNPLRQLLGAVTKRLALMLGLTVFAGMFEWVPLLDVVLDFAAVGVSAWYWFTLPGDLKSLPRAPAPAPARSPSPQAASLPARSIAPSSAALLPSGDRSPAARP